ncbi:hypothetical protein I3842_12G057900 [Carya illinoinensis]|uniref:Probable purine permease n=1 Tax=Carya illinoinensis TaxID=32201 RepID=A0A922IVG3_CARIL|nr:hypothetical protein I3842_12G057900 [Carya illinoinensis]
MAVALELQGETLGDDREESSHEGTSFTKLLLQLPRLKHYKWWLRVVTYILFLLAGQSAATLLGRLYYDEGGNSKWMATFVQSAGFPILVPLLFLFSPSIASTSTTSSDISSATATPPPLSKLALLYLAFGLLLAVNADSENTDAGVPKGKYVIGFLCTLGASATFSLYLSLVQLSFQKVIKRETFSAVLNMQIYPSLVATCVCVVGLFASGDWKVLGKEMKEYGKGRVSYLMTLIWTAVTWQISSVGMLGLIVEVSSLFSNVIGTLALPVVPILAVIFFHDKLNGVKVMALLLAIWGFLSYIYQHYLDDSKSQANKTGNGEPSEAVIEVC